MRKMRINEIFYSLQGEGCNTGRPAVFVRFSGCNIKCPFCDTEHQKGENWSVDGIVDEVCKYPAKLVILTGGEPTMFVTDELIDKLHARNKQIAIETNGTRKVNPKIDFITLSPKFQYVSEAKLAIQNCNELKVVFSGSNDMSDFDNINADYYYIQPCDTGNSDNNQKIIIDAINYIKKNPKWRLSLQTQKILAIR